MKPFDYKSQISLADDVLDFINYLEKEGFAVYIVGGATRDHVMNLYFNKGLEITDYDFEVHIKSKRLKPDLVSSIKKYHKKINIRELKFGVVEVKLSSGFYEFSMARKEVFDSKDFGHSNFQADYILDHDIYESLSRRDFTINCILYRVSIGQWKDPYNGIFDIQNHILRTPNPNFARDWLRYFRTIRHLVKFDFQIGTDLLEEIKNIVLQNINFYQFHNELIKSGNSREFCLRGLLYLGENSRVEMFYFYLLQYFKERDYSEEAFKFYALSYEFFNGYLPKDIQVKKSFKRVFNKYKNHILDLESVKLSEDELFGDSYTRVLNSLKFFEGKTQIAK